MKLSEINGDHGFDILIASAPYVEEIAMDAELERIIKNRKTTKDKEKARKIGLSTIWKAVAHLVGKHREAVFHIMSAVYLTSVEEIRKQSIVKILFQLVDLINDSELLSFFPSLGLADPEK